LTTYPDLRPVSFWPHHASLTNLRKSVVGVSGGAVGLRGWVHRNDYCQSQVLFVADPTTASATRPAPSEEGLTMPLAWARHSTPKKLHIRVAEVPHGVRKRLQKRLRKNRSRSVAHPEDGAPKSQAGPAYKMPGPASCTLQCRARITPVAAVREADG